LLLENTSPLVAIGGTLVYVVCSIEPEENEQVVEQFLKARPQFEICKGFENLPFDGRLFIDADGFFRTFPHVHDMDGFFAVRLKRTG
jgi:16S rRNA (cytosine967-C5)-methyltransferase